MDDIPRDQPQGHPRGGATTPVAAPIRVLGKLTLLQRRLSHVLLLNAYDTLTNRLSHQIDAATLCLMAGDDSADMEMLAQSLRGLVETVVEWDMPDGTGQRDWGTCGLLGSARLRNGICDYAYAPVLAEKLCDPGMIALIDLALHRRCSTGPALALYEACHRFLHRGTTGWWDLDMFRRLMGVEGLGYYEVFKQLNAKIIKPALAEVNRTSNITLTVETRKQDRAVTEIRFRVAGNPHLAILEMADDAGMEQGPDHARLRGLGVSDRLARHWLAAQENRRGVSGRADVETDPTMDCGAGNPGADEGGAGLPVDAAPEAGDAGPCGIQKIIRTRTAKQRDADKRLFLSQLTDARARADFQRHGWLSPLNARRIAEFWDEMSL